MHSLLAALGNPHFGRQTVHVTGSKGKGSTSAFVSSILAAAGQSNSLYTSPHLHGYTERICFDLEPASEEEFAQGVSAIEAVVNEEHRGALGPISTFGAMTALYFYLTSRRRLPWQVVEVGMGGSFDATNVFERTDIVVITAISLEHTSILGRTAAEIAENKAGLIRPGSIVVLAEQKDLSVLPVIEKRCRESGADLIDVGSRYRIVGSAVKPGGQSFVVQGEEKEREFSISMLGEHQLSNALTAIAVADVLAKINPAISSQVLKVGLERVSVPGRLELVNDTPLVVLDGAHNGESTAALVAGLNRHSQFERLLFVVGVNSDKDIDEILGALSPACAELIITKSVSEKAMELERIEAAAVAKGLKYSFAGSCRNALELARAKAGKNDLICVTGSLYLVGEARELLLGSRNSWSLVRSFSEPGSKTTTI